MKNNDYCYPTMWKLKHNEVKYSNDDKQLIKVGVRMLTPAVHLLDHILNMNFIGKSYKRNERG